MLFRSTPEEQANSLSPQERNRIKNINQDTEKAMDRDIEDFKSPADKVDKEFRVKTKFIKRGYECVTSIYHSDAMNNPGQGLYIWTQKEFLKQKDLRLKFGQYGALGSPKTPVQTISGYEGPTMDTIVILYAIRLDDYFSKPNIKGFRHALDVEKYIQKEIIKRKGYKIDLGTSTEVFGGMSLDQLISLINETLFGSKKLKNFTMRAEQKAAHDQIVNYFKSGGEEFLLAAKMRFGKNFVLLNAAKSLDAKNILVLTYKPHVFPSLKDDIENHVNFNGWKIVDFKKDRNLKASKDVPTVFLSSAQLAQYKKSKAEDDENYDLESTSIQDIKKNLSELKKIKWDMIIADEYHYGTSTVNFQEMLKQLNYKRIVYVSGTAMKDIEMGRFADDEVFEWSYIDEQEQKKLEQEGKSDSKQHLSMPTMEMHLVEVDPEIVDNVMKYYDPDEGFTMAKMIATDSKGVLKNPGSLELLLKQIAGSEGNIRLSPYRIQSGMNHTLWVLDKNVKGIKAMAKLMESMPEYKGYDIIPATGNVVTNIDEVKERINKNDRTITLTCYRFKEGTSVPEWNGVLMLDSGKSIEEYLQAIFRSQNPDPDNDKEKCYVFDFSPVRALNMTYEIVENTDKKGNKKLSEIGREYLDYAPILDHRNNKIKKVDFNEVIENFRAHGSFAERFANVKNIDLEKIDIEVIQSVSDIKAGKRGKTVIINNNEIELGKNFIPSIKIGRSDKKLNKNEIKKILEKITTVLSNIPEFMFDTPNEESTVDDILNTKNPELFEKITGLSIEDFKMWVNKGIINKVLMNRNVLNFLDSERRLMEETSLEKIDQFAKKNFNLQGEDSSTPSSIVNEMLDKLPKDIWKDPNKKFCDPVCGSGKFLVGIKDRLMEGLTNEIPDKEEREKHIIENQIYGFDNDNAKTIMSKRLINNKDYNDNIYTENSLTFNWNNMPKFDVVVGNPPYIRGTHLTFIDKAYELANEFIVFIQPATWVLNENSPCEKVKNLIGPYVKSIKFIDGNPQFGIIMASPLSITFINKKTTTDIIDVEDLINNKKYSVDDINLINKWGDTEIYPGLEDKIKSISSQEDRKSVV